ncbi:MAG TPA: YHS domain-containing protein [Gammaproteobacteria bacterium]
MGDFLSFLVFAGLFYVMMRHGCGAHMVHGKSDRKDVDHTDPVCGMKVNQTDGYGMMHSGQLYRFCSRNCLDKFETDPEKYIHLPVLKEDHHE